MFMILLFFVFLIIGMPVFAAMSLAAVAYIAASGNVMLIGMAAQRMYAAVNSFTLLAIPFFIFAGLVMNMSGVSRRLFDFAGAMVGHYVGGLAHVNVIASMLFAGMSGSAVADAAGLGAIEMKAMKDAGFDDEFSGAVTAASSTIGPVIPPSIPMVLFGGLTGVSVGRLFIGGFIPGLIMGGAMMLIIYYIARKRKYPRSEKIGLKVKCRTFVDALPSLVLPVGILGGILTGFFTPTEAAAVACVYALFLGIIVYKEINFKSLPKLLAETMQNTAQVLAIIAAAGLFGWLMTYQGIPAAIIRGVCHMTDNRIVVLLLINLILLILGCFMEGNAIMILTIPVFMPLARQFGIDLIHLGVIMCLNIMVGTITPPVGMCLYPICTLGNIDLPVLCKELLPFILVLLLVILLITFVSPLATFLPGFLIE